jgi:hypothetical protein
VVPRATGHVLGDVGVNEPGAGGFEIHVSIADIRLSLAKGFYFRAVENQSGLISLEQMVIVGGRAVLRHNLLFAFFGLFGLFWWFGH